MATKCSHPYYFEFPTRTLRINYQSLSALLNHTISSMELIFPTRHERRAFGIPIGLAGHAVMWKAVRGSFIGERIDVRIVDVLNVACWFLALTLAAAVTCCYLYKVFTSFPLVMAEYLNGVRCHFFNAPNLIFVMLLIGIPEYTNVSSQTLRILWAPAFIYQLIMTSSILFSKRRNFTACEMSK